MWKDQRKFLQKKLIVRNSGMTYSDGMKNLESNIMVSIKYSQINHVIICIPFIFVNSFLRICNYKKIRDVFYIAKKCGLYNWLKIYFSFIYAIMVQFFCRTQDKKLRRRLDK